MDFYGPISQAVERVAEFDLSGYSRRLRLPRREGAPSHPATPYLRAATLVLVYRYDLPRKRAASYLSSLLCGLPTPSDSFYGSTEPSSLTREIVRWVGKLA